MSVARKDSRTKLDEPMHRALKVFAKADGCTEGEYIERVLVPHLRDRVHATTVAAAELALAGITGISRESSGAAGRRPK